MQSSDETNTNNASRRTVLGGILGAGLVASSAGLMGANAAESVNSKTINRQWLLKSRPNGKLALEHFEYKEVPLGDTALKPGEIIVRSKVFAPIPSQRVRMGDGTSYEALYRPMSLGKPVEAGAVAEVVKSENPKFPVGALMSVGGIGWQDYARLSADQLARMSTLPAGIDPLDVMGIYGGNALTAYFGLLRLGDPKEGDTVVVSGASGSVGQTVLQLARIKKCNVIGIAGGKEKCEKLVKDYGIQGTIDYKGENVAERLKVLAPKGVNVFYDNVGGPIMQDTVDQMAKFGRVVLCGAISAYDSKNLAPGPRDMLRVIIYSVKLYGFQITDFMSERDVAMADLRKWKEQGLLKHKVDVREGFKNLPDAFFSLFTGEKEGTLMVKVA